MIFELIEDLRAAADSFPAEHPGFARIALLREATLACIAGLVEEPRLFTQTLTNHLRRRPVSPAARWLLTSSQDHLLSLDWWIRSEDGVTPTVQWESVVAVSPLRGIVHCLAGPHEIVDRRMDTQETVGSHDVPTENLNAVAVCPADGRVAVVGADGEVHTDEGAEPVLLRPRSNCFAGLGHGFLGVNRSDELVYWDRATSEPRRLAGAIPRTGSSVFVGVRGWAAVVLAGDRPGSQRVLLVNALSANDLACEEWTGDGGLATAACVDERAESLVLATIDRRLRAFDVASRREVSTIPLGESPGRPLSEVIGCTCVQSKFGLRVAFSDEEGVVGFWDTAMGDMRRVARIRAVESSWMLVALEWMAGGDRFVVASRNRVMVVDPEERMRVETAAAVTGCAVNGSWVAVLQAKAQRVTWYRDGAAQGHFYHPAHRPRSVAACGGEGEILVGGSGSLLRLRPGGGPSPGDGLNIFDRPVVAVLAGDRGAAIAVCETGEIKQVRLAEERVEPISPPLNHWLQFGACWLGTSRDIVSWGRSIADASPSCITVTRAGGGVEDVFSGRSLIAGVASTGSRLILAAMDDEVVAFAHEGGAWKPVMRRRETIEALACIEEDHVVVVRSDRKWLEVWSTEGSMKTVAMCFVPVSVRCLTADRGTVVVGTDDGRHIRLTVHRAERSDR